MNMDYREPRNGDFANYVEELSRHFDMKEQAVNPDFTSGFPSQLTSDILRGSKASSATDTQYGTASGSTAVRKSQTGSSQSADMGFPVPPSGTQHTGFETRPAAEAKARKSAFPLALVLGLVALVVFILSDAFGPGGSGLHTDSIRGPLIFILVIIFIIFRRIRNAAKRFPTQSKITKQT